MKRLKNLALIVLLLFSINTFAQDNKKGTEAPNWVAKDVNGKVYSLTDFAGKYIMIDVWATWCGPCRNEIPHYAKIIKKYKGRNIQFLSISIDSKLKRWKDFISKEEIGSLQLIDERADSSPYVTAYRITGIPRFIIINPEGKIVEWIAPRPSSVELDKLLAKLLK